MRLSSVFGLSAHTIDERFNFEEQRFRGIDKFLRLFVRNAYTCMEALKVRASEPDDGSQCEGYRWEWYLSRCFDERLCQHHYRVMICNQG